MIRLALCASGLILLAACSTSREPPMPYIVDNTPIAVSTPVPTTRGKPHPNRVPAAFLHYCSTCHTSARGARHGIGPNLWGVAGKAAADRREFYFSDSLKSAALQWDDATLDRWLTSPRGFVPGTKMTFSGLRDPAKRSEIIAYLKSLK